MRNILQGTVSKWNTFENELVNKFKCNLPLLKANMPGREMLPY